MTTTPNRGDFNNSFARGVGIALVVLLSGLLLAGCSYSRRPGSHMMGYANSRFDSTVCTSPSSSQRQRIEVGLSDMGRMMGGGGIMDLSASPSTVASGNVNIVVTNFGFRTHELVILPLTDGQAVGQRTVGSDGKVDEGGSVGEVSNNCGSGTGKGILAGSLGWTMLTLTPGHYEFICNLSNHYSAGMYQEVIVNP